MNKEQYPLITDSTHMTFEFESTGPRGSIKKGVKYTLMLAGEVTFYNLAFGDINEKTGDIDDFSTSNNADRDKVLATVAATVIAFTDQFPETAVHAEGSTQSRTRLYQMGIAANFEYIGKVFHIYGLLKGSWFPFEKNINYEAFIVQRK